MAVRVNGGGEMDVVGIGETMVSFMPDTFGRMRYMNRFTSRIAGAETNTLIGLAKLNHQVGWISRVGEDEFGASILKFVRGEGVDISQVKQTKNIATGIFFKEVINENDVHIYYYRKNSAASTIERRDINEEYVKSAKYLYLTGITPALSESCREAIFHSIEVANFHGVKVVFDPNIRKKLWKDDLAKKTILAIAEKADILLPGIEEGEFLVEKCTPDEIAKQFHRLGIDTVVLKLGEKGAYYSCRDECGFAPAYKISRVVDPVGAGDGFAAGLLSGMLDQLEMAEAVARGCAVGALVATVSGDVEGLPDREQLKKFTQLNDGQDVSR